MKTDSVHVAFTLAGPESSFKCPRLTGGDCNCTAYCGEYCRAKAEPAKPLSDAEIMSMATNGHWREGDGLLTFSKADLIDFAHRLLSAQQAGAA